MSRPLRLEIPGLVFEIEAEPGIEVVETHPLYRGFVDHPPASPPTERVPVRVTIGAPLPDAGWPLVFDTGDRWLAFRDHGDLILAFRSPVQAGAYWWTARISGAEPAVAVVCDPEFVEQSPNLLRIANPIHYPLDQLLTMMLLSSRGGCVVHAAGVHRSGRGIACIGRSGSGKTTLMGLLDEAGGLGRLSDDRLILRAGGPHLVSGTPWAGEGMVAANHTAELAALLFLHQGPAHELTAVSPQQAAAQLLPTTSIPWFDEGAMTGCLDTLDRLVNTVPAYNLMFRLDRGVGGLIDRII